MEKIFLNIDDLSQHLGIKKSTLYAMVERREIPFYRVGRRILFKKDEIDDFMDKCRVECLDVQKEATRILKGVTGSRVDIDRVTKNAIDEVKKKEYTFPHGKPDQSKGLRKGVENGTL